MLLHSFARLAAEPNSYRVRAVHIDHGLHADSALWRDHCERQAQALQVEFTSIRVGVTGIDEVGLEAAARATRYDAFAKELRPGEYLLIGHHADDQLETILLALMRGAGVLGLGAMQVFEPFARGALLRPLWDFTRAELEMWARAEGLHWLTDPSNDQSGARSQLHPSSKSSPHFASAWPAAAQTALRSSQHLQEARRALEQLAAMDAEQAIEGECLKVAALAMLNPERRRNLLRYWIRRRGRSRALDAQAGGHRARHARARTRIACLVSAGMVGRCVVIEAGCTASRNLPALAAQQVDLDWPRSTAAIAGGARLVTYLPWRAGRPQRC